jgi:hypothetical protein
VLCGSDRLASGCEAEQSARAEAMAELLNKIQFLTESMPTAADSIFIRR